MKTDTELYAYRRHLPRCPLFERGGRQSRGADRCRCPFHVDGKYRGERIRQSLKTRSQQTADRNLSEIVRRLDAEHDQRARDANSGTLNPAKEITLRFAVERFLGSKGGIQPDGKYRGDVKPNSFRKYECSLKMLSSYCDNRAIRLLAKVEVDVLEDFRGGGT